MNNCLQKSLVLDTDEPNDELNEPCPIEIMPCQDVTSQFSSDDTLFVQARWSNIQFDKDKISIALLCHLMTGGPCAFAWSGSTPIPSVQLEPFDKQHYICATQNIALIVAAPTSGSKTIWVPMHGKHPSRGHIQIFAVYLTSQESCTFIFEHIILQQRLPVIFDLDETLIKASTEKFFLTGIDILEKEMNTLDLRTPQGVEAMRWSKNKIKLLEEDQRFLKEFKSGSGIKFYPQDPPVKPERIQAEYSTNGNLADPRWDTFSRPCITHPQDDDIAFTQIEPASETSMVFRFRKHWKDQWKLWTKDDARVKIDAYVCTTAQLNYALEAWRWLDRGGRLIPRDKWMSKITTDIKSDRGKQKSLSKTLQLPESLDTTKLSAMPLAFILDDSPEVWLAGEQQQVMPIEKFNPYDENAKLGKLSSPSSMFSGEASTQDLDPSELQLMRAWEILDDIYDEMFKMLDALKEQFHDLFFQSNSAPGPSLNVNSKTSVLNNISLFEVDLDRGLDSYKAEITLLPWVNTLLPGILSTVPAIDVDEIYESARAREERKLLQQQQQWQEQQQQWQQQQQQHQPHQQRHVPGAGGGYVPSSNLYADIPKDFDDEAVNRNWNKKRPRPEHNIDNDINAQQNDRRHHTITTNNNNMSDMYHQHKDKKKKEYNSTTNMNTGSRGDIIPDSMAPENGHRRLIPWNRKHPVVKLSLYAQANSKNLTYEHSSKVLKSGEEMYVCKVKIDEKLYGIGESPVEEEAQMVAAERALKLINANSGARGSGGGGASGISNRRAGIGREVDPGMTNAGPSSTRDAILLTIAQPVQLHDAYRVTGKLYPKDDYWFQLQDMDAPQGMWRLGLRVTNKNDPNELYSSEGICTSRELARKKAFLNFLGVVGVQIEAH